MIDLNVHERGSPALAAPPSQYLLVEILQADGRSLPSSSPSKGMGMEKTAGQLVEEIIGQLATLPGQEALKILNAAQGKILHDHIFWKSATWDHPLKLALGIKGGINNILKVERDPEIKAYILSITETIPITEVLRRVVARFGAERAPSRSALSRWVHRQAGIVPIPRLKRG